MSTAIKRTLAEAIDDAKAFRDFFPRSTYDVWEFAGSVRRCREKVGDVEHVIVPKFGEVKVGLFATTQNLLWIHLDALVRDGVLAKHDYGERRQSFRWGEKYRGVDYRGFNHEMFTTTIDAWGAIFLIRTGPASFSRGVVERMNKIGLYKQIDGRPIHVASGERVVVRDEAAMLKLAGLDYIAPEDRDAWEMKP